MFGHYPIIRRTFLLLHLMPVLWSCQYNDYSSVDPPHHPIDSEIVVELLEILKKGPSSIKIFAKTDTLYSCFNNTIRLRTQTDDDAFKISYTGINFPPICATALGPARGDVDLGPLRNGQYWLELNHGGRKNKGLLIITDTDIDLLFAQLDGIQLLRTNLKRVPPLTYWGRIGYHDETSIVQVDEFLKRLEDNGAIFAKQIPGDYGYYQIDGEGEIKDPENHGHRFVRSFIFQYDGNAAKLEKLIRTGAGLDISDLSILVTSFEGEVINNWSD